MQLPSNPTYLLQQIPLVGTNTLTLHPEAGGVAEALEYDIWRNRGFSQDYTEPRVTAMTKQQLETADAGFLRECLPIGSIEFVDAVRKKAFGLPPMKPLNVPEWSAFINYWLRRVAHCCGEDSLRQLFEDWEVGRLFIKSATRLKTPFTGVYALDDVTSTAPFVKEEMLLVSTVVHFVSEWRVFVRGGRIEDIRYYSGNPWVMPDRSLVASVAEASAEALPAGTIDVGVISSGETVIVEVHKFVSCGLYGANVPLSMYKLGYQSTLGE